MVDSLLKVLMERDDLTEAEALELIEEAKQRVREGDHPRDVLEEEFGLEPDYFLDLFD